MNREHNSSSPTVSIILPFLNGGAEFAPALRSILEQSFTDWELLLCDDGSTDGSLELARAIRDPRVIVWSDGKSKGLAARLNECIDRSSGSLIARMDADDISYPHRLRQQVSFLEARPEVDVVGCPMMIFEEDGSPIGKRLVPLEHEEIIANPASGFGLAHPTWLARAGWYRKHHYDPAAIRFEDIELLYRSYPASRFANVPQLLYGYRELRGGFRKRLKTRLGRLRYLRERRDIAGPGLFWAAAFTESLKLVSDAALAATSTRYRALRLREHQLEPRESAEWHEVFNRLNGAGSVAA